MLTINKDSRIKKIIGKRDFYVGGEIIGDFNCGWQKIFATVTRIEDGTTPVVWYKVDKIYNIGKEKKRIPRNELFFVKDFGCAWYTKEYIIDRIKENIKKYEENEQ